MVQFQLFDSVKLTEQISIEDGGTTPEGCSGATVEVFSDGEAYMVELFGRWVIIADDGEFAESTSDVPDSFMETIGVETVAPYQIRLVTPASETVGGRAQLLALMDELPDSTLEEVRSLAESLRAKQADALKAT